MKLGIKLTAFAILLGFLVASVNCDSENTDLSRGRIVFILTLFRMPLKEQRK